MSDIAVNRLGAVFLSLVLTVLSVLMFGLMGDIISYPSILLSSILILAAGALVIYVTGFVSVPSLFWALVAYPSLIPFLADYIFHVPHYSVRGIGYAEENTIRMGVFLVAVFLLVFAGTVITVPVNRSSSKTSVTEFFSRYRIPFSPVGFAVMSGIVIISAYLTTPGPTILTVSYDTVIDNYLSWATFAGSLYMGSWIIFFLSYRSAPKSRIITSAFIGVTVLSILWLILHARRNESIGILMVLAVMYGRHLRVTEIVSSARKTLLASLLVVAVVVQVSVGELRSGRSVTEQSLRSLFVSDSQYGEFIHAPGGAHNIFSTYQFTLHHVSASGYYFGETFGRYWIQIIPTPLLRLLPVDSPPIYNRFMETQWGAYPGGNYLLNEYVLNFSTLGVIVAGLLFGVVSAWVQREVIPPSSPTLVTALAAAVVVPATRAMWYHQLNFINALQAVIVAYALYLLVLKTVELTRTTSERSSSEAIF